MSEKSNHTGDHLKEQYKHREQKFGIRNIQAASYITYLWYFAAKQKILKGSLFFILTPVRIEMLIVSFCTG